MGLIVLPSLNDGSAKARIGFENIANRADAAISASSEDGEFPVENMFDWRPNDFFKPASVASPVTVDIDLDEEVTADYLAFYSQNLFGLSGTIKLQYHNGSGYIDASPVIAPTSNAPRMVFFAAQISDKWRLVMDASDIFAIGVVSFGQYMGLPRGMYMNWTSPFLARNTRIINSKTEGGTFIGRSAIPNGFRTTLQLNNAPDAWVRSTWIDFVEHAEGRPFFFSHDVNDHPTECAFCLTEGQSIPPPTQTSNGYMKASIPIEGQIE